MVYNTFEKFRLKTYPQIEELNNDIKESYQSIDKGGGVILMGPNLLSQPAQAIKVGFSFANLSGVPPTGADQLVSCYISKWHIIKIAKKG